MLSSQAAQRQQDTVAVDRGKRDAVHHHRALRARSRLRRSTGNRDRHAHDPPGLTCAQGTCYGHFTVGSTVTLTATPGTARWVQWHGACSNFLPSCRLVLTGNPQVTATFAGANYVFVTSTAYAASAVAPDAADRECNARASAAGAASRAA